MTHLDLYCNCTPTLLARESQFQQHNLICHSVELTQQQRANLHQQNYLFDDVGENISALNPDLGDLTGLYWVWRNSRHDFVGTNQYRRFWNQQQISQIGLKSNTVYVYKIPLGTDTLRQFIYNHGVVLPQLLYEAALHRTIDMSVETVMAMNQINFVYGCNMFFCQRELFNRICQKFFGIMMEIYQGTRYALPYIETGRHRRGIAFLAERVLTLMLVEHRYYFGDIDIQPIDVRVV